MTDYQAALARLLAENRTFDSYLAGGVLPRVIELRNLGDAKPALADYLAAGEAAVEDVGDTLYVYAPDGADPTEALELPPKVIRLIRPANLEDVFLRLTGRALQE